MGTRNIIRLVAVCAVFAACSTSEVGRDVGARCDDRAECDDRCLPPVDYPGGFCTLTCETHGECPAGSACVDEEGGVCLFTCEADDDCLFLGEGWICELLGARQDGAVEVMVCDPS